MINDQGKIKMNVRVKDLNKINSDIIKNDSNFSKICNSIFEYFYEKIEVSKDKRVPKSFNLSGVNVMRFKEYIVNSDKFNSAAMLELIENYCKLSSDERELIIFREHVCTINKAINLNEKIRVRIKEFGNVRMFDFSPISLKSEKEKYNYILSENNNRYNLSDVLNVIILK